LRYYSDLSKYSRLADYTEGARTIYFQTVFLDDFLFKSAMEFYNQYFGYIENPITKDEALSYSHLGVRLNSDLWKSMMPMTEEKMDYFYKITPFHFFHDIVRFMDGMHMEIKHELLEAGYKKVLDFAGGTGGMALFFAQNGCDVTFYDSSDIHSAWMKWISNKLNLNIKIVTQQSDINEKYDLVMAKDIAEHVIDPGSLLEYFKSLINEGGKVYYTQFPCCGPEELAPMHFKIGNDKDNTTFNKVENLASLSRNPR